MGRTSNKKLTDLGKFLMRLCESNNELQCDMANKLNVSNAFLTRAIYGDKSVPADWYYKINKIYYLTEKQQDELDKLIFMQPNRKILDLTIFDDYEREYILNIAYDFCKNN